MNVPALKLTGISKKFGENIALDSVSLQVCTGETFGLLGPNGAGKSTLINIICGVLAPDSGEIEYFGSLRKEPSFEFKLSLGVIPQEISLYDKLSAKENLEFYGSIYELKPSVLKARIDETLNLLGLHDRRNDRIETYSGGMKRRINIAASILHSPKFILMDEPTVGIDPQSRNLIFEVMEKLHEKGATIIYTSHYMEEVERLCGNIAILDKGKIIASGTRSELIQLIGGVDTIEVDLEEIGDAAREQVRREFIAMKPAFKDLKLVLMADDGKKNLAGVINRLQANGAGIKSIMISEPNLETVFLHLTGKALRD